MVTTTTPGGPVAPPCSSRLLLHQTLLWHHRLGHPSLPRLRGMHSRLLVSGLPRSLPPLSPSLAPPCLPCVEGRQHAAPHSSFPPTSAPLQTLHMEVWGPARSVSSSAGNFARTFQSCVCTLTEVQNGIAERRIGLVMEVDHTSMIHAAPPHIPWSFAVRYAAHQLKLWPRVSLPETSPTLRWTGEDGDASVFRVWVSCAFVRDTSADKLSARAIPCVFLGFPPNALGWQFYHPTSRRVLPSQDVMFDESVPFYCLFPYLSAPPPLPPLFVAPGPPPVDPLPPKGLAPSGVSEVDPLLGTVHVEVAVDSGAARGAAFGGAASGGAEPPGEEPGGAEPEGAESGGAEPRGTASFGSFVGALPQLFPRPESLSPQQLHEWFSQRTRLWSGAARAGDTGAGCVGATSLGSAGVTSRAGGTGDPAEPCGAGTGGVGAGGTSVGGAGARGTRAGDTGAVDPGAGGAGAGGAVSGDTSTGGTVRPRPYFVPLLQEVQGLPSSTGLTPPFLCPPPSSCSSSASSSCPRHAHYGTLSSSIPLRVPLPPPPESSLPAVPEPQSDLTRAACPTVSRLIATIVTDPSFESHAASALIAELVDFSDACRLDYATALVVESESAIPSSVGGECALGTDVLEDRQEEFECLADAEVMDVEMASWKSTSTYVDAVPPSRANIVDGMWIFRVKQKPSRRVTLLEASFINKGSTTFRPFSPTLKITTLWVLLHVAAQRDYELHSLDFSTTFLQGSLHEEIWLCRPPGFTGLFSAGTQWSLRRPVYGLRQAPREWDDTLRTTLAALGFTPSTADPSLFLRTDTSLLPFYVHIYVDDLVFATADTEALTLVKLELQKRQTCTDLGEVHSYLGLQITRNRARRTITLTHTSDMGLVLGEWGLVVLTSHADASWVDDSATQRSSQGYTFSLGFGSVSKRSTRSSSVLSSSVEAKIYAGAMATQELRWLTYLLTDLGEQPCSPPVLYVDNKAMIALCQEHRLEHRTKHIALRYFLARELEQRGQLCLAYMATRANTADIFTKALPPGDHQCYSTMLGLVPKP
ncbi:unnamed protein product [Closterium sp. NIES-54]